MHESTRTELSRGAPRMQFPGPVRMVAVVTLVAFCVSVPGSAQAISPVKLVNWAGTIDYSAERPSPFTLAGNASHLGRFTAYGEVALLPSEGQESLGGDGVVVFTAANGDLLAGVVMMQAGADTRGSMHFSWRDSVQFSDGRVVSSTGRFADPVGRPPGLVVIAIIAILIGLLVPDLPPRRY